MQRITLTEQERALVVQALQEKQRDDKNTSRLLTNKPCQHCQDRPGYDGLGRTCKTCEGKGTIPAPEHERVRSSLSMSSTLSGILSERFEGAANVVLEVE